MAGYFEKQRFELCALHALNNLFQKQEFTRQELDDVCRNLDPDSFLNAHKSWIPGFGNYDYNVIAVALKSRGYSLNWFDSRRDPSEICTGDDALLGLIANISSNLKIGPVEIPFARRHWVAIRDLKGMETGYYLLDSKLPEPKFIGNKNDLVEFLREWMLDGDKQVMFVLKDDDDISQSSS
ncbi:unnamed protein product [Notodromas monacha]|uniref:ubiquitinyl hydrolase 1 n=1 Tax=Notodromas monacha TaxID=399045 RepID=A0A7R9BN70_9CRUS|nr:unnamed protein product [Notodromas monacha]CAG0918614.1 unnamed protein product [Notodromas monacha]